MLLNHEQAKLRQAMRTLCQYPAPDDNDDPAAPRQWPGLRHKRRVETLAKLLKIEPEVAAEGLMKAWRWAAERMGTDGLVRGHMIYAVDDAAGIPNFGAAAIIARLACVEERGGAWRFLDVPTDAAATANERTHDPDRP